jgi:tol-pal system protein YbgF
MMRRCLSPLAVGLCLLAAGCTGNAVRSDDPQSKEMDELKARVVELQRKAAVSEVEIARLREEVAELQAQRGGGRAPAAARPAAPSPRTSAADGIVTAPAPRPGPPPRRGEPSPALEEADIDLPPSPAQPAKRQPPPPVRPSTESPGRPAPSQPPPAATAPGAEGPSGTLSPAAQALYDRGYALYHQGHYVDAEASFQRFLQANPKSDLSDNAEYWIGECRYARGDTRGALAAFRETVERFPEGNKVADALLKAGQCLEAMGDVEGARVTYREVTRRFPGTAASAVAEERLGKLR